MKRRTLAIALAAITPLCTAPLAQAAVSQDDSGTTALQNSGRLSTSALQLQAKADGSTHMTVTLQVAQQNIAEAQALIASGTTISPAEYKKRFGADSARIKQVGEWAKSKGLRVVQSSQSGGQVVVTGDVSKVNATFKVTEHRAKLHGQAGLAVDKAPTVPSDLGITGIAGLNTVGHVSPHSEHQENSNRGGVKRGNGADKANKNNKKVKAPQSDGSKDCAQYWGDHLYPKAKKYDQESNVICGYTPDDLATMYDAKQVSRQKPVLGILLWGGDSDIQTTTNQYMKDAGYPALTDFTSVIEQPSEGMADCSPNEIGGEQALDVQSSHAIAPNAAIRYYGAASCYDADLTSELQKMVDDHEVTTISMSFGMPYDDGMTAADMAAWDRPLMEASLTGISTFASSGDDGNNATHNDLGPNGEPDGKPHIGYPASSAYTTAVGGTSIGMLANGQTPVVTGWEDNFYNQPDTNLKGFNMLTNHPVVGAGGGVSAVSYQPSWQKGVVTNSTTNRAVPDISAIADPYTGYTTLFRVYDVDENGNRTGSSIEYSTWGGTSLASPVVAAMTGLAKSYNKSNIGLIAPLLYKKNGSMLRDVNAPNSAGVFFASRVYGNEVIALDGKPQNLASAHGWDNVTGLGEPVGMKFIKAIK